MERHTQIVCSIGPASRDRATLERMVEAGMDWARLNLSHGLPEEHGEVACVVRDLSTRLGRPVKILADLEGPKLRIGELPASLDLQIGEELVVFAGGWEESGTIPVPDARVFKALSVGDRVFLDDGAVELEITHRSDALRFRAVVTVGGRADSRCGLTILGKELDLPALSEQDLRDVSFAQSLSPDAVAQSMVRKREDVDALRKVLGSDARIVSKIETSSALRDLERIAVASWGLMVARGDLGVNIPRGQVPLKQKAILELSRRCHCFGIVATQVLPSVVHNRRPNRAEVSDVVAAILDGCDAIMLSEETSIGRFPVDAVREICEITETVEASRWYPR